MAIIAGNWWDDHLVGTSGDDVINGLGGNDYMAGLGGADILNGGYGWDTVYYWDSGAGVTVNLATGRGSGGDAEGDRLFNIENVEGSNHNDVLTGDAGSNNIIGGNGDDILHSGFNTDPFNSFDFLGGGDGNDHISIFGGGTARGGLGDDTIVAVNTGNPDNSFVLADYQDATSGIIANLTGTVQGGVAAGSTAGGFRIADGMMGGTDLVFGVHAIRDSSHDDQVYVDSTYQNVFGESRMEVRLGAGNDLVVFNGVTTATIGYRGAQGGVFLDLEAGTATDVNVGDNLIGNDIFVGATHARGSLHNDVIYGRGSNDARLSGGAGHDQIFGFGGDDYIEGDDDFGNPTDSGDDYIEGGAGADTIRGGIGFDIAGYSQSTSGVTVNLGTGVASGGEAEGDILIGIEGLEGSAYVDTLTGDAGSNYISGGGGDDVLHGGGITTVNDWDNILGGGGNDTITIVGIGNAQGGAGNDRIIGQVSGAPAEAELDYVTAEYWDATSGIFANLTAGTLGSLAGGDNTNGFRVADGQGGIDLVSGVHQFIDSAHDDIFHIDLTYVTMFGPFENNWIEIRLTGGNDTIVAAPGMDTASVAYSGAGNAVYIDLRAGVGRDLNPGAPPETSVGNDTFSGMNRARGSSFGDEIYGADVTDHIRGRWGDDYIDGRDGDDFLYGDERFGSLYDGNDTLVGGRGFDFINGGGGYDIAVFDGLYGAGNTLLNVNGTIYVLNRADRSYDTVVNVEGFSDGVQIIELDDIDMPGDGDALAYAASYDDLAKYFRTDAEAAGNHYLNGGFFEGREASFDALQYLENWSDLSSAFGTNTLAATQHFLLSGVDEGRLAEDPLDYIASYADLANYFGSFGLSPDQMRSAGLSHYMAAGAAEGRRSGIDFDADQYLANNADVSAAFGGDEDLATWHFINAGRNEGRMWEDPLEYIASWGDLISAFGAGSEAEMQANALLHFRSISAEEREMRRNGIDFDVDQYLANYADLRAAFADGTGGYDEHAATMHYIWGGFNEGRSDDPLLA